MPPIRSGFVAHIEHKQRFSWEKPRLASFVLPGSPFQQAIYRLAFRHRLLSRNLASQNFPHVYKKARSAQGEPGLQTHVRKTRSAYSSMKLRWTAESTLTPGPMVEEMEMLFT